MASKCVDIVRVSCRASVVRRDGAMEVVKTDFIGRDALGESVTQ